MTSSTVAQQETTKAFLAAEEAWDVDANVTLRTDNCVYALLPSSMGHPERNNAEFAKFYSHFIPLWKDYKVDIKKIIHDTESRRTAIHLANHADTPLGPFNVETFFMLEFTQDGGKLSRVEEYVDSAYLPDFLMRAQPFLEIKK